MVFYTNWQLKISNQWFQMISFWNGLLCSNDSVLKPILFTDANIKGGTHNHIHMYQHMPTHSAHKCVCVCKVEKFQNSLFLEEILFPCSHVCVTKQAFMYFCVSLCACVWIYIYICMLLLLKNAQSCLTLCNFMGYSPPGSFVHGIFPSKNTGVGCHFLLLTYVYINLKIKAKLSPIHENSNCMFKYSCL